MLALKKLFSGNYLKKLHLVSCRKFRTNDNIKNKGGNKIIIEENNSNKYYLISLYESSIDINICEFDKIINQYLQTPIIHQKFSFIIFDSGIISNKIVLLTSIGLLIYQLEENKLKEIYNEIFNIKCEPKDILMYLKINEKLGILSIYSNTNLFFIYYYNKKLKKCEKVNQVNKLCNGFIKNMNIYHIEGDNNYFLISIQTQLGKKFSIDNYIYKFNIKENSDIINREALDLFGDLVEIN